MIATTTMTQVGLRLKLLSLEMQSLNDRSLKDKLLNEIIAFCVPHRYLQGFTVWGMDGGDAHMRLNVEIDYDEHDRQVKIHGDGLPEGIEGTYSVGLAPPSSNGQGPSHPKTCPYMGKALDLYLNLIKDQGLRLHWTVRFRENRAEMCEKFGLCAAVIHDCTGTGTPSTITSVDFPEMTMTGFVSERIVPAE
ncbi:MAG: hypothetical protein J5J06_15465 [Phycisphaerae bacterium]|nr:hypothetical protein [Phycisphaerae bacterium]